MKYVETGNASSAYRAAYDAENMKSETINVKACELLKNGKVMVRVNELKGEIKTRHNITVDDLIDELNENRLIALSAETPQTSAANAATMGKAKLLGHDVTKVEHSGNVGLTIEELIQRAKSD